MDLDDRSQPHPQGSGASSSDLSSGQVASGEAEPRPSLTEDALQARVTGMVTELITAAVPKVVREVIAATKQDTAPGTHSTSEADAPQPPEPQATVSAINQAVTEQTAAIIVGKTTLHHWTYIFHQTPNLRYWGKNMLNLPNFFQRINMIKTG